MDFTNITKALEKKGYIVHCFEKKEEVVSYLLNELHDETIALGGSTTLKELNLYEELSKNNHVVSHNDVEPAKKAEARREAMTTRYYISSVNGISEDGVIVNIDGVGNRVASLFFGHEKVYFVVGKNKIAKDYESALFRARNIAAPKNAQRFNVKTPCAVKGDRCFDCKSPERICKGLAVMWEKMMVGEYEILLVNEDLGY